MFSATKFVVAGVIVVLFGGFLLAGVLTQPQSEEPLPVGASASASPEATPGQPFTLPSELPEGIESGTLDTPLGPATWVHLTRADGGQLPNIGQAIPWPSGVAIYEGPKYNFDTPTLSLPPRIWLSSDGIDWRVQPLPVAPVGESGAALTVADGVYWLVGSHFMPRPRDDRPSADSEQIWRSTDGVTWEGIDTSDFSLPGPGGFDWEVVLTPAVTVGERTFIAVSFHPSFPFYDYAPTVGPEGECGYGLNMVSGELFEMVSDEPTCPRLILRLVETETGLLVTDDASGQELGEIEGAALEDLERVADGLPYEPQSALGSYERLLIINDADVTRVGVPWQQDDAGQGAITRTLFATQDSLYAYVEHREPESGQPESMSVWRSSDGLTWTDLGSPSFLDDAATPGWTEFDSLPGRLVATHPVLPGETWETTNGIDWAPAPQDRPDCIDSTCSTYPDGEPGGRTTPARLGSGWFASDAGGGWDDGDNVWTYVGDAWVSLDELGMQQSSDSYCVVSKTGIGQTTFFADMQPGCWPGGVRIDGPRDLWILSLDPTN